jgi:hypothetical protein
VLVPSGAVVAFAVTVVVEKVPQGLTFISSLRNSKFSSAFATVVPSYAAPEDAREKVIRGSNAFVKANDKLSVGSMFG